MNPADRQPVERGGPMRVLHFILSARDFRPFFFGLARTLDRTAVELSVCTMEPEWEFHRELAALGIRAHGLGPGVEGNRLRAFWRLRRLLARERPQILHLHLFWPALVGLFAARSLWQRPACVVTRHYSDFKYTQIDSPLTRAAYLALEGLLNWMTDRLIVLSELTERIVLRVERVPRAKVAKISLGFEFDEIQAPAASRLEALRREMGLEGHFVIGIIGRLSKEKGHRYLFQALSELSMDGVKPWKLLVVGEGPLRKQLEQQLTEQNLRDRAVLTGFSEQPLAMIALMDLVVQPSLTETFSRTMVESLALGKPLIMTKVSGVHEVMRDGQNGLIVPKHDPGALAAAIRRVMESPAWARQLGAQGARDVRVFRMERMAAAYQSCYRELMAQRGNFVWRQE